MYIYTEIVGKTSNLMALFFFLLYLLKPDNEEIRIKNQLL